MLILSRKSNESIVVGGNIRITVASIRGRYVRIGIEAPEEVKIYREELCVSPETAADSSARPVRTHSVSEKDHRSVVQVGAGEAV